VGLDDVGDETFWKNHCYNGRFSSSPTILHGAEGYYYFRDCNWDCELPFGDVDHPEIYHHCVRCDHFLQVTEGLHGHSCDYNDD
jgi:hypothetical protein